MKPSEALGIIDDALDAVYKWDGDPDAWPTAAVSAAYAAVSELVKAGASVGPACQLPKPNEVDELADVFTLILTAFAHDAKTDPVEKVKLVAALGSVAIQLVKPAADMQIETSRRNREKAKKLRKLDETKKLHSLAREVLTEWERGDNYPHRGKK